MGGHNPAFTVRSGEAFTVFTEDCFSGRLTSTEGRPREIAPFPRVNPLVGPIAVNGVKAGDTLAIRLLKLEPARDWGVATISPNFGLLSGTRLSPNLQREQTEHVWIWRYARDHKSLTCETADGRTLSTQSRPFHGTLGVAPPNGEVRLGIAPGDYGGNLDIPDLAAGATLYLRANVDGGHVYIGDGHLAQGDGEIAGTGVEGAFFTTMRIDRLPHDPTLGWPRLETETHFGAVGVARPLDDAVRIAASELVRWVETTSSLTLADAHQFVSQNCRIRIGNLVNPAFTVLLSLPKDRFEAVLN
jgi:acetamidase/formamidase